MVVDVAGFGFHFVEYQTRTDVVSDRTSDTIAQNIQVTTYSSVYLTSTIDLHFNHDVQYVHTVSRSATLLKKWLSFAMFSGSFRNKFRLQLARKPETQMNQLKYA